MKRLTIVFVLLLIAGVSFVFRGTLHNQAEASRSPERADKRDRAADLAALGEKQPPPMVRCAADLGRDVARDGDLVLARIAAECGNVLFEKVQKSPANQHLLNQASQHYRACLAHEPTCREAGSLFRDARNRLEQLKRMLADARNPVPSKEPVKETPQNRPQRAPEVETPPPAPKVTETDEPKMVGPDGVIYKRIKQ